MTNDAERVSDIVARLRGANSDRITPIDALRLHDENPGTFPLSPEDVEGVLDIVDKAADIIEAQSKALAEARATAIAECAKIVDEFSPVRDAFTTEDEGGLKWPHPAQQMPIYNPEALAAKIRALGDRS